MLKILGMAFAEVGILGAVQIVAKGTVETKIANGGGLIDYNSVVGFVAPPIDMRTRQSRPPFVLGDEAVFNGPPSSPQTICVIGLTGYSLH